MAKQYTGRWAIKLLVCSPPHHSYTHLPPQSETSSPLHPSPNLQVLQMTLRKHHPDGHWCNALEKNIKGFIREFDGRLLVEKEALSEQRVAMQHLLAKMKRLPPTSTAIGDARDHSSSEWEAEQIMLKVGHIASHAFNDRTISACDLKDWLSGEA